MLGRGRRQARRDVRAGATRYQMREKLLSIGDDFWIDDESGQHAFKVDGKALRARKTMKFEDASGRELAKIQERWLRVKDTMVIEDPDGKHLATVKKALISPIRHRFVVKLEDGPDLDVKGNIVDHEYSIGDGRTKVGEVSKRWFRVRDTYGVEVAPDQNVVLVLAITACLDQLGHDLT
jgi:uncharacterized protein YxjI